MALGLFLSAFARTEFQAVQFMPAFILPQILLCGLIVPRDQMAEWLQWIAALMPFTYAYDALARAATGDPGRTLLARRRGRTRGDPARPGARRGDAAPAHALRLRRLDGGDQLEDGVLRVAEEHRRLRVEVELVVDPREPGRIERFMTTMLAALSTSRIGMP